MINLALRTWEDRNHYMKLIFSIKCKFGFFFFFLPFNLFIYLFMYKFLKLYFTMLINFQIWIKYFILTSSLCNCAIYIVLHEASWVKSLKHSYLKFHIINLALIREDKNHYMILIFSHFVRLDIFLLTF